MKKLIIPQPGDVLDAIGRIGEPISQSVVQDAMQLFELGSRNVYQQPVRTKSRESQLMGKWEPLPTAQPNIVRFPQTISPTVRDAQTTQVPDSFTPSPPSVDMVKRVKPGSPNQLANADPRWGNKTAFASKDMLERQKKLETYSVEVAMLIDGLRAVVSKVLGRLVRTDELDFYANFGSPVTDDKQKISVMVRKPLELQIQVVRALVAGALQWSAEVAVTENTPMTTTVGRMIDLKKASGSLSIDPITATGGTRETEGPQEFSELPSIMMDKKRRKIRL
jgi:hypothetical protein